MIYLKVIVDETDPANKIMKVVNRDTDEEVYGVSRTYLCNSFPEHAWADIRVFIKEASIKDDRLDILIKGGRLESVKEYGRSIGVNVSNVIFDSVQVCKRITAGILGRS